MNVGDSFISGSFLIKLPLHIYMLVPSMCESQCVHACPIYMGQPGETCLSHPFGKAIIYILVPPIWDELVSTHSSHPCGTALPPSPIWHVCPVHTGNASIKIIPFVWASQNIYTGVSFRWESHFYMLVPCPI